MSALRPYVRLILWAALILLLPPLGAWLGHEPLGEIYRFPPFHRGWDPLPFSPTAYWTALLVLGAAAGVLQWHTRPASRTPVSGPLPPQNRGTFPAWGWSGVTVLAGALLLATSGITVLGTLFLWYGLLVLVNADATRRLGHCLMTERPGFFLSLLPAGVLVGWLFHHLNLFLQDWQYPGLTHLTPFQFSVTCTLQYAMLLPLLFSLRQWLASHPALLKRYNGARPLAWSADPDLGWILLGLGCTGLVGAGIWPDRIFPLGWSAPLLIALGLPLIAGKPTLFSGLSHGDWSRPLISALAALLLGLADLAWNAWFGPLFTPSIPLLQGPALFGLSLPAYAQFVVLGLVGLWVGDQLVAPWRKRPKRRFPKFPVKIVFKQN